MAATDQSVATVSLQTTPSGDTTVTLEVSIGGALAEFGGGVVGLTAGGFLIK